MSNRIWMQYEVTNLSTYLGPKVLMTEVNSYLQYEAKDRGKRETT